MYSRIWIQPVTPLPHRFSSACSISKSICLRPFKFGMWVHMERTPSLLFYDLGLQLMADHLNVTICFCCYILSTRSDGLKYHIHNADTVYVLYKHAKLWPKSSFFLGHRSFFTTFKFCVWVYIVVLRFHCNANRGQIIWWYQIL